MDKTARLAAARQLLRAGEPEAAERETAALCAEYPAEVDAAALYASCAAARGDWAASLARWQDCRDRFANFPTRWRTGLAMGLLRNGRPQAAEAEFIAAMADEPTSIDAEAGRALAVSTLRPAEAELLWRDLLRKRSGKVPTEWQAARVHALIEAGAHDRAATLLELALAEAPDVPMLLAMSRRLGR